MVEANYVSLGPGETKTMRFDQGVWNDRPRKDPSTGITSDVKILVMHVTELGGLPVSTVFSVISQKLQEEMKPYLDGEKYKRYRFTITRGTGTYDAPRIAAAVPV